jgi:hypothetical protein
MTLPKKMKHSKYRNSGILFELLVRQVTADILNSNEDSKANGILRKYFSENTELGKENRLYRILFEEKVKDESSADRFLETVIKARKKINEKSLVKQKYDLISEIKKNYPIDDFLKGSINNYKSLASIYKIFEEATTNVECDPREVYKARNCIIEGMVADKTPTRLISEEEKKDLIKVYQQQNEEVRLLAYKLLIDSFNDKYKNLNENQKLLIREYINNISNTNSLRQYINKQIPAVKAEIISLKEDAVDNSVIKIKLVETINQLDKVSKGVLVKENHVMAMLLAYELIKELKLLKKK